MTTIFSTACMVVNLKCHSWSISVEVHTKSTPITTCCAHSHTYNIYMFTFLWARKFKKYRAPRNTIRQHTTTSRLRFAFSKNKRKSFSNSLFLNFNLRRPNLHSLSPSSSTSSVSAIAGTGCIDSIIIPIFTWTTANWSWNNFLRVYAQCTWVTKWC